MSSRPRGRGGRAGRRPEMIDCSTGVPRRVAAAGKAQVDCGGVGVAYQRVGFVKPTRLDGRLRLENEAYSREHDEEHHAHRYPFGDCRVGWVLKGLKDLRQGATRQAEGSGRGHSRRGQAGRREPQALAVLRLLRAPSSGASSASHSSRRASSARVVAVLEPFQNRPACHEARSSPRFRACCQSSHCQWHRELKMALGKTACARYGSWFETSAKANTYVSNTPLLPLLQS